jgi:hypothetical protein
VKVTEWWQKRVRETVELCPSEWAKNALEKLAKNKTQTELSGRGEEIKV